MTDVTGGGLAAAMDAATTRATTDVTIWLDAAAWSESQSLRQRIAQVRGVALRDEATRLQADLDQLQSRLQESALTIRLEALTPAQFDELILAYPSTDPTERWNPEKFHPALIAASVTNVSGVYETDSLSVEEVTDLFDRVNAGQQNSLVQAALVLNLESPKPFTYAAGTATTRSSEPNSTNVTANGESLTPGS